jgi:hypothetical protein
LGSLDMREFFPLFINGDLVTLANVEKIPRHELRTPPKAQCSLFDFAGHPDRTDNQAIGRNPGCVPIFKC